MPKFKFVDFKAIKAAVTMEQVLQHYGLLDGMKRSGDSLVCLKNKTGTIINAP